MAESKLTDLEVRYAWLERHVAEQDRVMLGLGEEIRRLRRELEALRAQVGEQTGTPGAQEAPEAPPPHY